jgi:hypothetical protein
MALEQELRSMAHQNKKSQAEENTANIAADLIKSNAVTTLLETQTATINFSKNYTGRHA